MQEKRTTYISQGSCVYEVLDKLYKMNNIPRPDYMEQCVFCNGFKRCNVTLDELVKLHEDLKPPIK